MAVSVPTDIGKNTPDANPAGTVTFVTTASVPAGGKILLAVAWAVAGTTLTGVSATGCTGAVEIQQANGNFHFALAYLDAPSGLASGSTVTATFSAGDANSRHICGSYVEGARAGAGAGYGAVSQTQTASARRPGPELDLLDPQNPAS